MSDRIKKIKIKQADGTYSDYIPIGADAKNIDFQHNGTNVESTLKKKPYYYENIEKMKLDDSLQPGDMAITLGYYEANDGGGATYKIRTKLDEDIEDNGTIHSLSDTLVAQLVVDNFVTPEMFGAIGDGEADDTRAIQICTNFTNIYFSRTYFTSNIIFSFSNAYLYGNGTLKNGVITIKNCNLKDINFLESFRTSINLPSNAPNNKCIFDNISINTTNGNNYMAGGYGVNISSPNFRAIFKNCYFTKTFGIGAIYVQADGYLDVDNCTFYDLGSRGVHIRANNVSGFLRNSKLTYLGTSYVETGRESVACGIYGHSTGDFKVLNNEIEHSVANCIEGAFTEVAHNYLAHTFEDADHPNPTGSYQGIWLSDIKLPSKIHHNVFNDISHGISLGAGSDYTYEVDVHDNIAMNLKEGYYTIFVGNSPAKHNIFIHDNPNATLKIGNNSVVNADILPETQSDSTTFHYIKRAHVPKLFAYSKLKATNIGTLNLVEDETNGNYFTNATINLPTNNTEGRIYLYFKVYTNSSMSYTANGTQYNISTSEDGMIERELVLFNDGTNLIGINGKFTEVEIDFIEY